jgi:hypothetical protein
MIPDLRIFAVPHDILAEQGPDAVIAFCQNALAHCIKSIAGLEPNSDSAAYHD